MKLFTSRIIQSLFLMMSLLSVACSQSAPKSGQTVINPASVNLAKHYRDEDSTSERVVRISITPTTQPTAATRPVIIPFDGRTVEAPAGAAVTFETRDTGKPALSDYSETANAVGAGIHTDSDKGSVNGSAPAVELGKTDYSGNNGGAKGGGSTGTGGKVSASWVTDAVAAWQGTTFGVKMAWLLGLGLIALSVAYVVIERLLGGKTDWLLAVAGASFGVATIILGVVADKYPWILVILGLLGVAAIVWYVWRWKKKEDAAKATPPVVVDLPKP